MLGIAAAFTGCVTTPAMLGTTVSGKPVCRFSVAVDSKRRGTTSWVRVSYYPSDGEALPSRLLVGTPVYVVGTLELAQWVAADGKPLSALDVTAKRIERLGLAEMNCSRKEVSDGEAT